MTAKHKDMASFFGYSSGGGGLSLSDLVTLPSFDTSNVTSDLELNGHRITEMADPTSPTDGATKAYVDSAVSSLIGSAPVSVTGANNQTSFIDLTSELTGKGVLVLVTASLTATTPLSATYRIVIDVQSNSLATESVGSPAELGISFQWVPTSVGSGKLQWRGQSWVGYSSLLFEYQVTTI